MRIPRPQLNYANVIATVALFVALGGAAVAAGLPKNSVGSKQLKSNAVTKRTLHGKAVTAGKLAPQAVTAGKLASNSVQTESLRDDVITPPKLTDGAIITSKIRSGAVTSNKLDNGAVITGKLDDGAVTNGKLADKAVTLVKIAPGVIGTLRGGLDSGETLRGVFDVGGSTKLARQSVSFQFPLQAPPAAAGNILAADGNSAACPGLVNQTPEASPGQLCLYVKTQSGNAPNLSFDDEAVTRVGFGLKAKFGAAEESNRVLGYWAVTAP
jgi:hypothetical protein